MYDVPARIGPSNGIFESAGARDPREDRPRHRRPGAGRLSAGRGSTRGRPRDDSGLVAAAKRLRMELLSTKGELEREFRPAAAQLSAMPPSGALGSRRRPGAGSLGSCWSRTDWPPAGGL